MGSYGIGVERAMAAIAEVHHDDAGLKWPVQVAPADVNVIMVSAKDEAVRVAAEAIYAALQAAGHDVIIDDRDERPGVKFKDAELIGFPVRISVGSRDLADGVVEVVSRESGERERVPVDQVVKHVQEPLALAGQLVPVGASSRTSTIGRVASRFAILNDPLVLARQNRPPSVAARHASSRPPVSWRSPMRRRLAPHLLDTSDRAFG
jgi:hypothetical protein